MTNYRNSKVSNEVFIEDDNATDTIRIYGASTQPVITWKDYGPTIVKAELDAESGKMGY